MGNAKLLVVDDERQIRHMFRYLLEKEGYEVAEASDGEAALDLIRENHYDLIIMDLIMPKREGIETLVKLRKEYKDMKIIAISGGGKMGPENYLLLAERCGASYTFTKPIDNNELLEKISELLMEE